MQLLDRYLTAIKFWLPKKQRDDIAANLQSAIDDRAADLGRPLTDDEVAALLKQHGSPILVASRYQEEHRTVTFGRQLIGPLVFPFYWTAIKVTLVLLLVPGVIPAVVLGTQAHGQPFAQLRGCAGPRRALLFARLAPLLPWFSPRSISVCADSTSWKNGGATGIRGSFPRQRVRRNRSEDRARSPASSSIRSSSSGGRIMTAFLISS